MSEFLSQTSVRFDGGGGGGGGGVTPPGPPPAGTRLPDPPPGSAIVKLNERIGISVGHLVENDQNAINVGQRLDVVHRQVCKSYSPKNLQNRFKAKQAL